MISYFEVHLVETQDPSVEPDDDSSLCASYIFEDASTIVLAEQLPPSSSSRPVNIVVGISSRDFAGHGFRGDEDYSVGYHGTDGAVGALGERRCLPQKRKTSFLPLSLVM